MKINIAAADSPDYLCEITVAPIGAGKPVELSIRRAEYVPRFDLDWQEWLGKRMTPIPVVDEAGAPVLNQDGSPKVETPDPISDEEFYVEQLRLAGASSAACKALSDGKKFPVGVLRDVYEAWRSASKVTPGESSASGV